VLRLRIRLDEGRTGVLDGVSSNLLVFDRVSSFPYLSCMAVRSVEDRDCSRFRCSCLESSFAGVLSDCGSASSSRAVEMRRFDRPELVKFRSVMPVKCRNRRFCHIWSTVCSVILVFQRNLHMEKAMAVPFLHLRRSDSACGPCSASSQVTA